MTALIKTETDCITVLRNDAAKQSFHPLGTMRCIGAPLFRTALARDLGCLLDVDPNVNSWSCLPLTLSEGDILHIPDFIVERTDRTVVADAHGGSDGEMPTLILDLCRQAGFEHEVWSESQIRSGVRLANAQELLRYARWRTPLGDRVRLLAALDENGTMTIAECLPAFRETPPIAGLASLILHRFVEIDLDEARIGPETSVRRTRG
ncbi:hypothetical protein ABFT80_23825 [Mesorhizobium sp. SB112]|uniref:hypothetical protein n=1 Tax=Mesorhizobium sp. SB112 TaxID=3151853 RepID=UPI0032631656